MATPEKKIHSAASDGESEEDSEYEEGILVPPADLIRKVKAKTYNNLVFCAMDRYHIVEKFLFDGVYTMIRHRNPHPQLDTLVGDFIKRVTDHMRNKEIYVEGNILYKENTPGVKDAIDLMVQVTGMKELPPFVDTSVRRSKDLDYGSANPTIDTLFRHNGMLFSIYEKYIYGSNTPYVRFVNENKLEEPGYSLMPPQRHIFNSEDYEGKNKKKEKDTKL